ncbi:hypothetical protein PoB_002574700 [Plakobranchus ocellatus]|uniref:Uncharacterized protein n=1 Tax=Plakobranchus ocellatus TaxID=259542 RepID=A0AAV3ZVZ7_9GAST|nr:hypothetical protein PoB_002574700 [Plakobranchus ocellatus]
MSPETKFETKMEMMKVMHKFELRDQTLQHQVLQHVHTGRSQTSMRQARVASYPYESYATAPADPGFFRPIDPNNPYHSQRHSRTPSATSTYSDSQNSQVEETIYSL